MLKKTNGRKGWINMENIQDLTFVSDDSPMIILFSNGDVSRAKEKEITNWILNDVFEEVEDEGQPTITVRWVITERVSDGNILKHMDTKNRQHILKKTPLHVQERL